MKPRIAIPIPTTTDAAYNQRSWASYADAVARSGGEPVALEIANPATALREVARTCSGVCLPGSPADVDPALYDAERDPASAPADAGREAADQLLLEDAARLGKPVLAICYGLQRLNVWRGGSLLQDLTPLPVNHAAGRSVAIAHTALVAPQSLLATLLDKAEAPESEGFLRLPVNSSHHQAVAAPGQGLRIVARCPDDGVIEALELDPDARLDREFGKDGAPHETADAVRRRPAGPQFLLGVQWHPERSYDSSATSRALFDRLVAEAAKFAAATDAATASNTAVS